MYICIRNPVLTRYSFAHPSTSRLADWYIHIFPRDWINFPSAERLVVEIRSCCRAIFINLTKKYRLKVGFGNYWRCSNVCGTVLVVTYPNDLPRQNHKQKGWINRLQEARGSALIRYSQLPWLLNGMQFRKGRTSSPFISTPFTGSGPFPCQKRSP